MRQQHPMIWGFAIACLLFCSTAAAASWISPLELLGIPPEMVPIIFMAFAGSSAGLIFQPPMAVGRIMMLVLTVIFTFVVTCVTIIAPHVPILGWLADVQPPTSGLIAFFAQKLVPAVGRRLETTISGRGATDQGAQP